MKALEQKAVDVQSEMQRLEVLQTTHLRVSSGFADTRDHR